MLPVVDPNGERTGRQAVSHTLGLLPISLCPLPVPFGRTGLSVWRIGAGIGVFMVCHPVFAAFDAFRAPGNYFLYPSCICPLLLGLMVFDKIK